MGITPKDIAAQRAMLERGEAIRKSREQREEQVRLRDTFAAAALTGLLSRPQWTPDECVPESYRIADAMLRERERTNHDASPEAKDRTAGELGGVRVTGNKQEPACWLVKSLGDDREWFVKNYPYSSGNKCTVTPLYRSPTLTDEEREAVEAAIHGENDATAIATLRSLLARLS